MSGAATVYTLWAFIEALVGAGANGGPPAVERLLAQQLSVTEETEAGIFYEGKAPALQGETRISRVAVVVDKSVGLAAVHLDLSGSCVSAGDIRQRYPDVYVADHPDSPAPIAETVWATRRLQVPVLFGFRNVNPECARSITLDFERHIDTYDLRTDKRGT